MNTQNRNQTIDGPDWLTMVDLDALGDWLHQARAALRKAFLWATGIFLVMLVPISIALNQTDLLWINWLIALAILLATAYHWLIDPYWFLTTFGLGAAGKGGLPNFKLGDILNIPPKFPDFQLPVFLKAGWEGVREFHRALAMVWMAIFMWCAVLGTIHMTVAKAALPLLVTILATGVMTLKWPATTRWYKFTCSVVTMAMLVIWVSIGFGFIEPIFLDDASHDVRMAQAARTQGWRDDRKSVLLDRIDAGEELTLAERQELEIINAQEELNTPQAQVFRRGGRFTVAWDGEKEKTITLLLTPGRYTLEAIETAHLVNYEDSKVDFGSAVLINGQAIGEPVTVGPDGKVIMSFAVGVGRELLTSAQRQGIKTVTLRLEPA